MTISSVSSNQGSKKPTPSLGTSAGVEQPHLSIIIPCFNEEETIGNTLHQIQAYCSEKYSELSVEILLIDDGSSDRTGTILGELAKKHDNVHPIFFGTNRGRGAAIKAGISESIGERVIVLDADLTYDVQHIGDILDQFETDASCDVVVVSAYMKGGQVQGVPFKRLLVSRMANWTLSSFFNDQLSTVTCVVRGYRGDLVRSIPFFEEGKELHLEMLRKLAIQGAHIKEIPGRLIWKKTEVPRRKNKLRVISSAKRHLVYGLLSRPVNYLKYLTFILLFLGVYEGLAVLYRFSTFYEPSEQGFWHAVWLGLSQTFSHSPHTVIISGVCLIVGFQMLTYLALFKLLSLQHEEMLRHVFRILERDHVQSQKSH